MTTYAPLSPARSPMDAARAEQAPPILNYVFVHRGTHRAGSTTVHLARAPIPAAFRAVFHRHANAGSTRLLGREVYGWNHSHLVGSVETHQREFIKPAASPPNGPARQDAATTTPPFTAALPPAFAADL